VKSFRTIAGVATFLAVTGVANAQDFKQRYIGKSPCSADIRSEQPDFSLRLDKTQNTTLLYRDLSNFRVVLIIQAKVPSDGCGVIRDVVQITRSTRNFEFRCFDPQAPTDVIVGTTARKYGDIKLVTAIDAWRIDLKERKFIETRHRVTCSADGWDGEDDDSDLVDESKKYAAHHKPGQFAPESNH